MNTLGVLKSTCFKWKINKVCIRFWIYSLEVYLLQMQQRVEEVVPLLVAAKQQQRVEEAVVLVFGPLLPSSTTLCAVADLQVQQQSKRVCETEQLDLLAVALSSTGVARRASKDGCVLCARIERVVL
jgi:hypothetical protein